MLAVSDGNAAIAFYKAAFGATVLWHLDGGGHIVAGLEIDGAPFFLAHGHPRTALAVRRRLGSRPSGSSCWWTTRSRPSTTVR